LVVEHLAGGGGGGVEHAVEVDGHHVVCGLLGMLKGALQVVDAGRSDQAVQALVLSGEGGESIIHLNVVANIDADVLEVAAVFAFGLVFGGNEFGMRSLESVQAVDPGTGLNQGLGHGQAQSTATAGDGVHAALHVELAESLDIVQILLGG